jgi:hypothetical protein
LESTLLTCLRQLQNVQPQRQVVQLLLQPLVCGMLMAGELVLEIVVAKPPTRGPEADVMG